MPKQKTITLTKDPSEAEYLVERVTDSVEYRPGTYLSEAELEGLCEDEDWKVTVSRRK